MDEKKLRVYTTAVSIAGLSVFLLSLWEVYPYYLPGSSRGDIWSYSLMMVLLMVVCPFISRKTKRWRSASCPYWPAP